MQIEFPFELMALGHYCYAPVVSAIVVVVAISPYGMEAIRWCMDIDRQKSKMCTVDGM